MLERDIIHLRRRYNLQAIFKEIERLSKLGESQLEDLEEKTKEICMHNYNLIFNKNHWNKIIYTELQQINNKLQEHGIAFLEEDTFVHKITRYHRKGLNFMRRVKNKIERMTNPS